MTMQTLLTQPGPNACSWLPPQSCFTNQLRQRQGERAITFRVICAPNALEPRVLQGPPARQRNRSRQNENTKCNQGVTDWLDDARAPCRHFPHHENRDRAHRESASRTERECVRHQSAACPATVES